MGSVRFLRGDDLEDPGRKAIVRLEFGEPIGLLGAIGMLDEQADQHAIANLEEFESRFLRKRSRLKSAYSPILGE